MLSLFYDGPVVLSPLHPSFITTQRSRYLDGSTTSFCHIAQFQNTFESYLELLCIKNGAVFLVSVTGIVTQVNYIAFKKQEEEAILHSLL